MYIKFTGTPAPAVIGMPRIGMQPPRCPWGRRTRRTHRRSAHAMMPYACNCLKGRRSYPLDTTGVLLASGAAAGTAYAGEMLLGGVGDITLPNGMVIPGPDVTTSPIAGEIPMPEPTTAVNPGTTFYQPPGGTQAYVYSPTGQQIVVPAVQPSAISSIGNWLSSDSLVKGAPNGLLAGGGVFLLAMAALRGRKR